MGVFVDYSDLISLARTLRKDGRTLVLVGGHFDLIHVGHVAFLEESSRLGDDLIVYLPNDRSTRNIKGPGRPVVPAFERSIVLAAMRSVAYTTIVPYEISPGNILDIDVRLIEDICPAIYVCVKNDTSDRRIQEIQRHAPQTKVVGIPSQSNLWSTTRLIAIMGKNGQSNSSPDQSASVTQIGGDDDASWIALARQTAKESLCKKLSVGAVLVKDGRVLATASNGVPGSNLECWCQDGLQFPEDWVQPPCMAVHAEIRVIAEALGSGARLGDSVLYSTHSPCIHCAKFIIDAGIQSVVYESEFRTGAGKQLLKMAGVSLCRFTDQP